MGLSNQDLFQFVHTVLGGERPTRVHMLVYDELRFFIDLILGQIRDRLDILREVVKPPSYTSNHLIMILSSVPLRVERQGVMPCASFIEHIPDTPVPFTEQAVALLQQAVEHTLASLVRKATDNMLIAKRKTLETRDLPDTISGPICEKGWRVVKQFLNLDDDLLKLCPDATPGRIEQVNRLITFAASNILDTCKTMVGGTDAIISKSVLSASLKWWFPPEWLQEDRQVCHFQVKPFRKMDKADRLEDQALLTLVGMLEWLAKRYLNHDIRDTNEVQFLNRLGVYMV